MTSVSVMSFFESTAENSKYTKNSWKSWSLRIPISKAYNWVFSWNRKFVIFEHQNMKVVNTYF